MEILKLIMLILHEKEILVTSKRKIDGNHLL
jgi:hypothetical protein